MTDTELNTAVAVKIFYGYKYTRSGSGFTMGSIDMRQREPATLITDAFEVVEVMRKRGWTFEIGNSDLSEDYHTSFQRRGFLEVMRSNKSLCRAVCEAALAAIEKEKP